MCQVPPPPLVVMVQEGLVMAQEGLVMMQEGVIISARVLYSPSTTGR